MKRIFIIILFLFSLTSIILADERVDSLNYYNQCFLAACQSGNDEEACICCENVLRLYRERKKDISQDTVYASIEVAYASLCYKLGDYETAVRAETELSSIFRASGSNINYAASLNNLAFFYSELGNYSEAIRVGTEAVETAKMVLGENHPNYVSALINLAGYYFDSQNYLEAIKTRSSAMEIRKAVTGEYHPEYASSLSFLARSYSALGDQNAAIQYESKSIEIRKKTIGINHPDYAKSLNCLFKYYFFLGYYNEAIKIGTEDAEIIQKTLGKEHPDYATALHNLSSCFFEQGNYDKAISLESEAMEIRKTILGTSNPDYAKSLYALSRCLFEQGNYGDAIRLGTEAMEILKKVLGTSHLDYAESIDHLAITYSSLGNYNDAIRLGTQAMEIKKKIFGTCHPKYAISLDNLASLYYDHSNYDKAISLGLEAMEILKNSKDDHRFDYAVTIHNLAESFAQIYNYDEAIRLEKEAIEIIKEVKGTYNTHFASSLNNLAGFYSLIGNYNEAIRLGTQAIDITKRTVGVDHPDYVLSIRNLAIFYVKQGKYYDAKQLLSDFVTIARKNVFRTFIDLTANERQLYWSLYNLEFNHIIPQILVQSGIPTAASVLYDETALFAKGLLLTTEQEMSKIIQESGDDEALRMFSELRQSRLILNAQYSKPIAERYYDCDSLEDVSANLERQLVARVKEFGDFTRNLSITWRDVQNQLGEDDIAIEFLSYQENDSTIAYVALTLCKNDTAPVLTPLFTNLQLMDVSGNGDTYQNSAADELIWGPLASRMEGKSYVYFSAAGMLHNIGIEYLPSMEGKDCYRLSSTRELVTHKPSEGGKSATLFGGIDYDANYASLKSTVNNEPSATYLADNTMTIPVGLNRGVFNYSAMRGTRYSVSRLPHSKTEIQEISAFLKKNGFVVQNYDTIRATEESFKALSGKRKSVIHISTHGFYYDKEEADNKSEHMRMMLLGENRPSHVEDQSLLRCGLCFAGANQAFTGDSLPADGQDDGILNALEIAQMDLRGLDLVVLSACQTALGDIIVGQGVFGLQRGFKKAGANSILMSLWEVDDEVTSKFMIEFYRQWTSGKTKMESLKKAQSVIRQEYPDPKYWAAFILLDALD